MASEPLRVLLVEDNPGDAHLLEAMLEEDAPGGVDLEWVQSLDDGVQRLTHGDYDAVLLDLSLPDSHGIESVSTTHLFDTETPIVVLTGLDDDEAAFRALREGAQDYLIKGKIDGHGVLRTLRFARQRVRFQQELAKQRGSRDAAEESTVRALVSPAGDALLPALADHVRMLQEAGRSVVYVTFDRPAAVLLRRFEKMEAPTNGLHFIDASGQAGDEEEGHIHVADGEGLDELALEVERACSALGPDAHVVVDSVNSLLLRQGLESAAVFCHSLANRLRLLRISADFVGHDNQEWPFLADRLSFLDGEARLVKEEGPPSSGGDPSVA